MEIFIKTIVFLIKNKVQAIANIDRNFQKFKLFLNNGSIVYKMNIINFLHINKHNQWIHNTNIGFV